MVFLLCFLPCSSAFCYSLKWQDTIFSAAITDYSSAWITDTETLSDGTIIVGASRGDNTGKILAYTPNGVLRWTYGFEGNPMSIKVSVAENRIYFTTQKKTTTSGADYYSSHIYGLDTSGNKIWEDEICPPMTERNNAYINTETISDGAIVVEMQIIDKYSGKILSYTPNGVLRWSYDASGNPGPVKVSVAENRIYFTTQKKTTTSGTEYYSSNIYGLDTSGNKIWEDEIWPSSTEGNAASVNSEKLADGAIVVEATKGDNAGKVMSYTPNGVLRWSYSHEGRSYLGSSLLVSVDYNRIYFTAQKKTTTSGTDYYSWKIFGLDTNGNKIWEDEIYASSTDQPWVNVSPEVISDGAIVVSASKGAEKPGKVLSYTTNGARRWVYDTDGGPNVKVSADYGRIYVSTQKKTTSSGTDYYSSKIYGLDVNGAKLWEDVIYSSATDWTSASINEVVLKGGAIVVRAIEGSNAGKVLSYTTNGVVKLNYATKGQPWQTMVSPDYERFYAIANETTSSNGSDYRATYIYGFDASEGASVGAPISWGSGKIAALFADYGSDSGIWSHDGSNWNRLTDWQPAQMIAYGTTGIMASFNDYGSGNGLYRYDGSSWNRLTDWIPSDMVSYSGGNIAGKFTDYGEGGNGIWRYNGGWTRLTDWMPDSMTTLDNNTLVGYFGKYGSGNGVYKHDGSSWSRISDWTTDRLTSWGSRLAAIFEGYGSSGDGLWIYEGSWKRATDWVPTKLLSWRRDELLAGIFSNYGSGNGLYSYSGTSWTRLTDWVPADMAKLGTEDLAAVFSDYGSSGNGVWKYSSASSSWTRLTDWTPDTVSSSGDYITAVFTNQGSGGNGVWKYQGGGWTRLTDWVPKAPAP